MAIPITALDSSRKQHSLSVDKRPDICPLCHHAIELIDYFFASFNEETRCLQVVHRCPKLSCQSIFIASYSMHPSIGDYRLKATAPTKYLARNFSDIIKKNIFRILRHIQSGVGERSTGPIKGLWNGLSEGP